MNPQNFLGQPPGGPVYAIPPTPPSQTQEVRAVYVRPGMANKEPLLSVSAQNFFTLTRALIAELSLGAKSRFRLVVPARNGQDWFLDTTPKHEEGHKLPERGGTALFRTAPIPRKRFLVTRPKFDENGKFVANENHYPSMLYFRLGEEVELGYYRLERLKDGTVKQ